jgi:hypothetical protein
VSFTTPDAARFAFTPPKGATVTPLGGGGTPGNSASTNPLGSKPQTLGAGWLSVLEVHGVDLAKLSKAAAGSAGAQPSNGGSTNALTGNASTYINALMGAGRQVTGAFGTGKLYTTNFLSVLITNDGRLFVGAVTPAVLEADAASQGSR